MRGWRKFTAFENWRKHIAELLLVSALVLVTLAWLSGVKPLAFLGIFAILEGCKRLLKPMLHKASAKKEEEKPKPPPTSIDWNAPAYRKVTLAQKKFREMIEPLPEDMKQGLIERYGETPYPPLTPLDLMNIYDRNFSGMGVSFDKGGFASKAEYMDLCRKAVANYKKLIEIYGPQGRFEMGTFDGYLKEPW